MESYDFSSDIIYEILTRSSMETVGRCRLLSKECNSITYDSVFTNLHAKEQTPCPPRVQCHDKEFYRYYWVRCELFDSKTWTWEQMDEVKLPNHESFSHKPTGDGMPSIEPTAGTINDIFVSGSLHRTAARYHLTLYLLWDLLQSGCLEEMEKDAQTTIYDNFKFLTKEDLEKLNLTSLIGTNLLRASMHGFFIDYKLYKKASMRAADTEEIEEQFVSQITVPKKLPKIEADKNGTKTASRKKKGLGPEIFEDERFKALFEDKDFEIDENSAEYLALHPMASMKQPSLVAEHFELLTEDEDQGLSDSDNSVASRDEHSNENRKFKKKPSPTPPLLALSLTSSADVSPLPRVRRKELHTEESPGISL
uniref:Uncharacterized protein n=1 Tax=Salix viminalis TaxID=40686 RepID=A0A6N2N5I0_SALVM